MEPSLFLAYLQLLNYTNELTLPPMGTEWPFVLNIISLIVYVHDEYDLWKLFPLIISWDGWLVVHRTSVIISNKEILCMFGDLLLISFCPISSPPRVNVLHNQSSPAQSPQASGKGWNCSYINIESVATLIFIKSTKINYEFSITTLYTWWKILRVI